ncbi:MAG: IgGFc-binding protein [bacterium]
MVVACGPVVGDQHNNTTGDGGTGACTWGDIQCQGQTAMICQSNGTWITEDCLEACQVGMGCVPCIDGAPYCQDDWVAICDADGNLTPDYQCPDSEVCILGACVSRCHENVLTASNVGCEFWAVDLDNEASDLMGTGDAAAAQYAVAVANVNDFPVVVEVYQNTARVGQTPVEQRVAQVTVAPNNLEQIDLPQREVDGCMGQNGTYVLGSGSGTFVSPHAYRVVSNGPVVAYQFNPVVQQFSNDASILIPTQALGNRYYVMGYPTANPCGNDIMPMASIPDHGAVTIVGVFENTTVQVTTTHAIMASDGDSGFPIAETAKGETLEFTVGPYDVVNLESLQFEGDILSCMQYAPVQNGDFSGTFVLSSLPVVVYSSNERGLAGSEAPEPPGFSDACCTEHFEQQMFPVTALGWEFAISRSPVRSTGGYREPDIYRIMATQNNTTITTTIPDFPSFTLQAGEFQTVWHNDGFIVQSQGGAIMVGQFLVSQGYTSGGNGDSTFTIFPAAEQHRMEYVFLVLDSFEDNYMVLAKPDTVGALIDGQPLGEFQTQCTIGPIGTLNNIVYDQMTCRMEPGVHTVSADAPVGLTVYGYYNVGSYGYPGGSDVKIINPVE